jgi:hypothetical protein
VSAAPVDESLPVPPAPPDPPAAAPAGGDRSPLRHPVRAWEASGRRWLPGAWYPVALWGLWRVGQLLLSVWLGGPRRMYTAVNAAFYYDGERYLQIARQGYLLAERQMPNTAFFPGVSWVAWPVWRLTQSEVWAGHVTATVTGLAAFVTVWGVTKAWTDEPTARRAVWLLALFPSSLFLWAFYSEGLFIALGAGAVWADRRGRPLLAALCLFGLSTTRSVGVLGALVLAAARIARERRVDRRAVGYAAAGVAGLVPVFAMMNVYTGSPLAFVSVQADWGRALSWPWITIVNGVESLWPDPSTIMVPALVARNLDLWCLPIAAVGIGWLAFARRRRAVGEDGEATEAEFPLESWMLGVALIALPLCSTSLASFNRFAMADWVIYPAYASLLGRLPVWWRRGAWAVLAVALAVTTYHFVGRFSVDRFVG